MFVLLVVYRLVWEDNEHGLFTVTLFKKVVDEFKHHAREKKLVVTFFSQTFVSWGVVKRSSKGVLPTGDMTSK